MKDKQLRDIVEEVIDKMFLDVSNEWELTSGDFSPEQDNELDKIKEDLYLLLSDYVNNNLI